MKKVIAFALLLVLTMGATCAYAQHTKDANYIYDAWGNANESIGAFEMSSMITADNLVLNGRQYPLEAVNDVYVHDDKVYMIDTESGYMYVLNMDFELIYALRIIRDKDGKIVVDEATNKQFILTNPEGVYVTDDYIYLADTGAERILILDPDDYHLVRAITKPDNMVGTTLFKPSKLAVDRSGRIFAVVQGSSEGIVMLNAIIDLDKEAEELGVPVEELEADAEATGRDLGGTFSSYFGLNTPSYSIIEYFWKSLATKAQREKMTKLYAPSFSNVQTDVDGFIYAVTQDTSSKEMVFRFNADSENVLRKYGYSETIGDLSEMTPSKFVDIAVSDFGVYALLDSVKGRVFLYNFDGNLLNVFGGLGNTKGMFKTPASISWCGNDLIVGDGGVAAAYLFKATEFGELILKAEEAYYDGDFATAAEYQTQLIAKNANYDIAYISIGKNLLMEEDYENAMYYFKLGNDKTYYSKAYNGYRNLQVKENFIWFALVILAFAFWIIYSEYKYKKQLKDAEEL